MADMKARNFTLDEDSLKYIDDFKRNKRCGNRSEALRVILQEHKENHDITIKNLYEFVADKVAEKLIPHLSSVKHGTNKTNNDTQVIIELLNGIYYQNNLKDHVLDSEIKPHGAVTNSKNIVKERILKQAYMKHNRND